MKQQGKSYKRLFIVLLIFTGHTVFCQPYFNENGDKREETYFKNVHSVSIGYGLYSFREVDNPKPYSRVHSTGFIWGQYLYNFDRQYSVGLIGGYEKNSLQVNGFPANDSLFIKTKLLLGKLRYNLLQKSNVTLYISGAVGIKKTDTKLLDEKTDKMEFAQDLVLIGLQYNVGSNLGFMVELAKSDLCLVKFGASFRF